MSKNSKKIYEYTGIESSKANAQEKTCVIATIAAGALAILLGIMAFLLPLVTESTPIICWSSMLIEAVAAVLGYVAWWINRHCL